MKLKQVQNEAERLRELGCEVSDVTLHGSIASYTVDSRIDGGYTMEVNLCTEERRNCGLGEGCFWTDWR